MKIAILGAGHVGLVTAVAFSNVGHEVVATDTDGDRIATLRRGEAPFFEPGLQEMLESELGTGRLRFTPDVAGAIPGAEVAFICVGTPPRSGGDANLRAVEDSARALAPHATRVLVVAEKSTVPAGTADRLKVVLEKAGPQAEFEVVSNPEFLREGSAVNDALHPDRILIGAESPRGFAAMRAVYAPFTKQGSPLIETDIVTAELSKHAANAFLALKISYMNAVARVVERVGADVQDVAALMGSDPRIGPDFLKAGLGFGGSCFHKDLLAFHRLAEKAGYDFPLLVEVTRINQEAVQAAADRVEEAVWNLDGKRIALLGLAFKPKTDDVRFAPALALARILLERGAQVVGYDPAAGANAKADLPELEIAPDPYESAAGAHCLVLCTEWEEFRKLDLERLREQMAEAVLVDARNFLDPDGVRTAGFSHLSLGRREPGSHDRT